MNPAAMGLVDNPTLTRVVEQVTAKLQRVIDAL
jgi:hypothetical protein